MNSQITIRNVGKMWRVCHGRVVLAFAETYPYAKAKADYLRATNAVERVIQARAAR